MFHIPFINIHYLSAERRYIARFSVNNDQARHNLFSSDFSDKKEELFQEYMKLRKEYSDCKGQIK